MPGKVFYRVTYTYNQSDYRHDFWIMASVIDQEKLDDAAWSKIKDAHRGIRKKDILNVDIFEIQVSS